MQRAIRISVLLSIDDYLFVVRLSMSNQFENFQDPASGRFDHNSLTSAAHEARMTRSQVLQHGSTDSTFSSDGTHFRFDSPYQTSGAPVRQPETGNSFTPDNTEQYVAGSGRSSDANLRNSMTFYEGQEVIRDRNGKVKKIDRSRIVDLPDNYPVEENYGEGGRVHYKYKDGNEVICDPDGLTAVKGPLDEHWTIIPKNRTFNPLA